MFSKELESLIQATLEDGILEDNEKAALVKRAQNEGVDLDELEIYINSILQKRNRELNEKKEFEYTQIEKKKKAALGKVCPKCGRQVAPLTLVCECGYEFNNEKRESAVELLSIKLSKIYDNEEKYLNEITMFPVPNTKEDIMEFLALAAPNSKYKGGIFGTIPKRLIVMGSLVVVIIIILAIIDFVFVGGKDQGMMTFGIGIYVIAGALIGVYKLDTDTLKWNKKAAVWRAKFDQVMMKGRSLRADADFTRMLDYYERQVK